MSAVTDVFRRFWRYTRGDRHRLALGGLGALAVSGCELGTAGLFGVITDSVLARHRLAAFWGWPAGGSASWRWPRWPCFCPSTCQRWPASGSRCGCETTCSRAQRLPPDFFDRRHLGDLMVRLTEDVAVVEGVVSSGLLGVATSAVSAALFAIAAFVISWPLALVAAAVAPVLWLASRGFSGRLQRAAERERVVTGKLSSAIEESLSNQALIQAFDRQADESRRLHAAGDSWLRASMAETRLSGAYGSLVYVIETLCVLTVFGFGAWELTRAAITLGGLLAFATLLAYLYAPVQGLAGYRLSVSEASESVARIAEILDARSGVADGTAAGVRVRSSGFIAFDNVCFAYPGPGVPMLRHLSFRAEPGQLVAITGPSGSGKSTVAKLLLRFYDPGEGRVLLDGIDIRGLPLSALRHSITLLQQENLLFSGTVADNIGYGRQGAAAAEIAAAAEAAGADDFIRALPDGYDTPVGQRGRLLSGGQRQRIAIARALLREAPVLVLDEPTAGLSPADARLVMKLLTPITAGRTIIVITHDPAVAAQADQLVTLDAPAPGAVPGPAVTEATTAASL